MARLSTKVGIALLSVGAVLTVAGGIVNGFETGSLGLGHSTYTPSQEKEEPTNYYSNISRAEAIYINVDETTYLNYSSSDYLYYQIYLSSYYTYYFNIEGTGNFRLYRDGAVTVTKTINYSGTFNVYSSDYYFVEVVQFTRYTSFSISYI